MPAGAKGCYKRDVAAEGTFRVGHGWDLHRLEERPPAGRGRALVIGGVELAWPASGGEADGGRGEGGAWGPVARSDGDVLLHALTDALLGALGMPDIGQLFPDTDEANEGRDSAEFVAEAVRRVRGAGWRVENVDATVILQRPKLGPVKERVRGRVAGLLGVEQSRVNVKGKTHERVDATGEGRAVQAHVVVLLARE